MKSDTVIKELMLLPSTTILIHHVRHLIHLHTLLILQHVPYEAVSAPSVFTFSLAQGVADHTLPSIQDVAAEAGSAGPIIFIVAPAEVIHLLALVSVLEEAEGTGFAGEGIPVEPATAGVDLSKGHRVAFAVHQFVAHVATSAVSILLIPLSAEVADFPADPVVVEVEPEGAFHALVVVEHSTARVVDSWRTSLGWTPNALFLLLVQLVAFDAFRTVVVGFPLGTVVRSQVANRPSELEGVVASLASSSEGVEGSAADVGRSELVLG